MLPKPQIKRRIIDQELYTAAVAQGFSAVVARVIAARPCAIKTDPKKSIHPRLADLNPPWSLLHIERAVNRVVQAILNKECIGLETDHDCDGQTAHAVIYTALVDYFRHPKELIRSYIGHRLKEGYGLSEVLAKRILGDRPRPSLVITADNGSSDEPRIAMLAAAGIDVIVTDHHEIPLEGVPESAYAVLNPTQTSCAYPDSAIAGCMVAWLLMAAVRRKLIELTFLPPDLPDLSGLLDFVAVGTIADCVSMASSVNNRAVVRYGLQLLEKRLRPCWEVLKNRFEQLFSCEGIAFTVAPLLNSDGRLESAMGSVSFLLSQTKEEALLWLAHLQACNQDRKQIQQQLLEKALAAAALQYQDDCFALSIFLADGHVGVHGIVASKIKDTFGLPCVMLAPKSKGLIAGSVRGIPGVHVRRALESVALSQPELLVAFGGHQGAAGLTLREEGLALFPQAFQAAVQAQISDPELLGPVIYSDGPIEAGDLSLEWVASLWQSLAPFGREFEAPVFELTGVVRSLQPLGEGGLHARLGLVSSACALEFTWFYMKASAEIGDTVRVLFTPKVNVFRGQAKLDLHIAYLKVEVLT